MNVFLASSTHVSYWETAPWWDVVAWLTLAGVLGATGYHIFRLTPRWPCVMQKWGFLLAYSLTLYSVGRIGYVFDHMEAADQVWEPLVYLSSLGAAVGFLGICSKISKLVKRDH